MTELVMAATVALLALCVLIQGLYVQRALDASKQALRALLIEIGSMGRAAIDLDDELTALKSRVAELEKERKPG